MNFRSIAPWARTLLLSRHCILTGVFYAGHMQLQYVIEHLAVCIAAITGVMAAKGKQVDLFGVIVLALVTSFGGGVLRDLMLGDLPVLWVKDPLFLFTPTAAALLTFFLAPTREFPRRALVVADAFVLALFTVVGARKAIFFQSPIPVAVAMGVITGVAGGVMRDLLCGEIPLVFRRQIYLYATASMAGALVFCLLWRHNPGHPSNMLVGAAATLLLRLAGIRWRIGLPIYAPKEEVMVASTPADTPA